MDVPDHVHFLRYCHAIRCAGVLTNNICNLLRSIWQIHVFPTPGSPAAEAKEKRDHVHENDRRAKAGLPSLEEEALQKAKEAAEAKEKHGYQRQQPSRKKKKK